MAGCHWPVSEMAFKWHFAGGPMLARFKMFDGIQYADTCLFLPSPTSMIGHSQKWM